MVLIKKYKGFKIEYNAGVFKGVMKNAPMIEATREAIVCERIDNHFRLVEEEKKRKAEEKRLVEEEKKFLKLRLSFDGQELKRFFKRMNLFTGEGTLKFKNNELSLIIMNPANVALCYSHLKYEGKCDEINTNININEAHNVLKSLCPRKTKRKVYVGFRKTKNEDKITFNNDSGMFYLPVIDLDKKNLKVPDLMFETELKILGKKLYEQMENAGNVKDSVVFRAENDIFKIVAEGDYSYYESFETFEYKGKPAKGKYSTEYLKKEYFDKDSIITLKYNTDYPLKLEDESGNWWILAPRVDNSD